MDFVYWNNLKTLKQTQKLFENGVRTMAPVENHPRLYLGFGSGLGLELSLWGNFPLE